MKKPHLTTSQLVLLLHLLFWIMLFLLPLWLSSPGEPYARMGVMPLAFYYISVALCMLLFYGNVSILYPKFCNRKWWWLYIICFVGVIIAFNSLKIAISAHLFPAMKIFGRSAPFIFAPTFLAMLAGTIYGYIADRIKTERTRREREAERLTSELKFLRSQVSPHFLFNVLTNLVSLARKKSDLLEPSLIRLSDLMRYMIYDTNVAKVSLEHEIKYLKNYISLQQLRFGEDVTVDLETQLAPEALQYAIEPMLLIPFVENAFKHGVGWIDNPNIRIHLTAANHRLAFTCENKYNPEDLKHKDPASGIGLANVKSRLKLLYEGRHTLSVAGDKNLFRVHLNLIL